MKSIFTKISLFFVAILWGTSAFAQDLDSAYVEPFSKISAFRTWSIGFVGGYTQPFGDDFHTPSYQYGYGGFIKKQILSTLGVQADFMTGRVTSEGSSNGLYEKYLTKINWAASLNLNLILANINWRNRSGLVLPYIGAGVGYMAYSPALTDLSIPPVTKEVQPGGFKSYFIPVSAGFKIKVSSGVNLDLGATVNFVSADNFDGVDLGNGNDRFIYPHFGLEFAIGDRTKQQLATHNPVASMRAEYLRQAQNFQQELNDQKAANEKLSNNLTASNNNFKRALTDGDDDGVADLYDKCANTPKGTKVDGSGCPLVIPLPQEKIVYVTDQDKEVVKEAVDNLEFNFNSAIIRSSSFPSLNSLAQLIIDKKFSLKLAGYTDNVGPTEVNLKFSQDRANAVKSYLISKGVSPAKIEAIGYGRDQPIASNATPEGRQQNRRVEFTLY
ncbi:MAG: OmpA family protein [Mucilaginibacter sp.]